MTVHTTRFRQRDTIGAVQLTADADWPAIAEWCRGQMRPDDTLPAVQWIDISYGDWGESAGLNDWICRYDSGEFFIMRDGEMHEDYEEVQ